MNVAPSSAWSRPAPRSARSPRRLGRHPSTIHRELGRNRFRDGDRVYDARRTVTFDRGGEFAGYAALHWGAPVATTVRSRAVA